MRKNRNLVNATVSVDAKLYAAMPNGQTERDLLDEVLAAMTRVTGERNRRPFGNPWISDVAESDGHVTLTYVSATEPA